MDAYSVGQILFIANTKSFKIIPIQVVEEVIRTTIDGKKKTYMVMFPDKGSTVADITDVNFNIFKTEVEVENFLLENTRKAIKELIQSAHSIKDSAFATASLIEDITKLPEHIHEEKSQEDNEDTIDVDLGNGQVAKMQVNDLRKVNQ